MATHIGPRGGRYRVVNGKKRYDVPRSSERIRAIAATPTGSALMAEADDAPATDLVSVVGAAVVTFGIMAWLPSIVMGWGWAHGLLMPLQLLIGAFNLFFLSPFLLQCIGAVVGVVLLGFLFDSK